MLTPTLIVIHVVLTTAGYVGLIAANAWLLLLCASREPGTITAGVRVWRRLARVFGPVLGAGMLAGFALAIVMSMPLNALWLVATYALIVLAMAVQGAIMVPWQLRFERTGGSGAPAPTRPIVAVLSALTIAYIGIASLMLLRPV